MMNKRKEPQKIAASKGSRSDIKSLGFNYYITILMTVTTIIASWHITDIWSGIVALLCGGISILLINSEIGGLEDESEKA